MILVIGDKFIDRYHIGMVRSISAEAPIPIVDIQETKDFLGGSANVLNNLMAMAGEQAQTVWGHISQQTPIKNRLVTTDNLQLARWDEDDTCDPLYPGDFETLGEIQAVVVSDYGKGSVTPELVAWLVSLDLPLFVDTKQDPLPWMGAQDITLFPNRTEYTRYQSSYEWFPKVCLKRGAEGLAWVEYGRVIFSVPSDTTQVVSVNGAGDTVLAAFVVSQILRGEGIVFSVREANRAAGLVVGKPFTAIVTREEMWPETQLKPEQPFEPTDSMDAADEWWRGGYYPSNEPR